MKTFIKTISSLLVFATIFLYTATAFASQADFEFNSTKYTYCGEMTDGTTLVWDEGLGYDDIEDLYVYYTFSIPSDGYYHLGFGTPHTSMRVTVLNKDLQEETSYNETDYDYQGIYDRIYFLRKGSYKSVIDVYDSDPSVILYSEYLGESITDISFNHELLDGYDFDWDKEETNYFFQSNADATITFSSGKTYNFTDGTLTGSMNSMPIEGKNEVTVEFLNQQIKTTATVYPISHYVSDAEINNIEDYFGKSLEYYERVEFAPPYGEIILFTFTDGRQETIEHEVHNNYIKLPNGQTYPITLDVSYNPYFNFNKGNCCMRIEIGNEAVKEYYFNGVKVSFAENIKCINKDTEYYSKSIPETLNMLFQSIGNKDKTMYHLENLAENIFSVYIYSFMFTFYYLTFSFI